MNMPTLSAAASTIYHHHISATRTVYATDGRLYANYSMGDAWAEITVEKTDTGIDVMVSTQSLITVPVALARESLRLAQEVTHLAEVLESLGSESAVSGTRRIAVA